jgi:pentatricopeptide repeat protein
MGGSRAGRNGTTVVLLQQQQLDIFAWNRKLARFFKAGQHQKAMELYQQLLQRQKGNITPDKLTFVPVLNACASLRALEEGRRAHEQIMQCGCCETDLFVGNSLVDIYAKCGSMEDAQRVFDKMASWNVVTWTAMMLGLGTCEMCKGTRHWNYFDTCNRMLCSQILSLLWEC